MDVFMVWDLVQHRNIFTFTFKALNIFSVMSTELCLDCPTLSLIYALVNTFNYV